MSKFWMPFYVLVLSLSLVFVGVSISYPELVKQLFIKDKQTEKVKQNNSVVFDEASFYGNDTSQNPAQTESVRVSGEEKVSEPEKQIIYQTVTLPTLTNPPSGIPEGGWGDNQPQPTQTNNQPYWSGFGDKEAYCRAQAESTKSDPKTMEIAKESYDELVADWDYGSSDSQVSLRPPTFAEYTKNWPQEAYDAVYRECIKYVSN
jgi:hypothetical protein